MLRAPRKPARAATTPKKTKAAVSETASAYQSRHSSSKNVSVSSILDRPYPFLSGRRCVPHLIIAKGLPFLRYKKPQPRAISGIINRRNRDHVRRWDRTYELRQLVNLGELEDAWDGMIEKVCGLKQGGDIYISWATESSRSADGILAETRRRARRDEEMTEIFTRIREKEKALAEQEKAAQKDEKQRRRAVKRLAQPEVARSTETVQGLAAMAG